MWFVTAKTYPPPTNWLLTLVQLYCLRIMEGRKERKAGGRWRERGKEIILNTSQFSWYPIVRFYPSIVQVTGWLFFFFGYQARPQKTKVTEVFYVIFFLIFLTLPSGILLRPTQTYTQWSPLLGISMAPMLWALVGAQPCMWVSPVHFSLSYSSINSRK